MKKVPLHLLCLFCLVFTGCAVSRTVKNNTFQSSSPEFIVTVSPEMKYFGNLKSSGLRDTLNTGARVRKVREETDAYWFIMAAPQKRFMIIKGVIIGIREVAPGVRYIKGDTLSSSHESLEQGICALSDDGYEFLTYLWYPNSTQKITAALKDAGFIMPKCVLIRHHQRTEYRNKIKFIDYWENAADSGYACEKWNDGRSLEVGQRIYLGEFNKRASESFKVVDAVK